MEKASDSFISSTFGLKNLLCCGVQIIGEKKSWEYVTKLGEIKSNRN